MWVGRGPEGERLIQILAKQGARTEVIAVVDAPRSPAALMVHQPEGSTACLFDPALGGAERLTVAQETLIGQATHFCISVGPPQVQGPILALCPPGARLYWAVKDDPNAFPPPLRQALAARADVVFCNATERALVGETRAVVVETRGRRGLAVTAGGNTTEIPVEPVEVRDTTGAGDSLAGGYIAAEMAGADPMAAARAGLEAATALLRGRQEDRT
jgi:ribokinase